MRICVQHTKSTPGDYVDVDSARFALDVPFRPEPTGGETIDDADGRIFALCVQSIIFQGYDHYHVEHVDSETVIVTCWNDDPDDWPAGTRGAHVWTLRTYATDPAWNGAINTRQTLRIYADTDFIADERANPRQNTTVHRWTDFVPPTSDVRHGIWVSDELVAEHETIRKEPSWRSWTEGLDASELDANGKLKEQRRQGRYLVPDGTLTWFQRDTQTLQDTHVLDESVSNEASLIQTTAAEAQLNNGGIQPNEDVQAYTFITPSGEPDSAAWPTGVTRCQLDGDSIGSGISYGLMDFGGSLGHFARLNAALTADLETKQQIEAAFTGTGLKLATTGSVSWTAGSATDRLEVLFAAQRDGVGHGNQNFHINVNTSDTFVDAPFNGEQQLNATVAGQSALTAALSVEKALGATVAGQSALTARLNAEHVLAATVAGLSAVSAALSIDKALAATIAGLSALSGDLALEKELSATVAGQSTLTAALSIDKALAATIAGLSAVSGRLNAEHVLAATVPGQSTVSAAVAIDKTLSATIVGQSALAVALAVEKTLGGTIAGQSTVSGDLAPDVPVGGTVAGQSSLTAALSVDKALAATVAAQSVLAAALNAEHVLGATVPGQSSVAAALGIDKSLAATVAGQSALSAALAVEKTLAGTIFGQSALTADLEIAQVPLGTATVAGQSTLSASLSIIKSLSGTIAGQSTLRARLPLEPTDVAKNTIAEVLIHNTIAEVLSRNTVAEVAIHNTVAEVKE